MYGHYDFKFNKTSTNNMRLKWLSVCFNIDYDNGTMELYLNGKALEPYQRKPMVLPADSDTKPLIVRLGRYFFDDTPLIGKIYDFHMWDKLLTAEELAKYTKCVDHKPISEQGNLINPSTNWFRNGSLIKPSTIPDEEITCGYRYFLKRIVIQMFKQKTGRICNFNYVP